MSYCLNASCPEPKNPGPTKICKACGSKILLYKRYLAVKKLGKGGFGATFLAVDITLPGTPFCVIKQLRPTVEEPGVLKMARELFAREAETLGKIGNHPQVPRLLDYFEEEEQFYLIQEFVKGNNLQQDVKLNGPYDEAKIRNFLEEILPILQYVHSQKVIHRDIKPANIIRRELDNKLVLIDFGAVKSEFDTIAASNTASPITQFSIGTLGFAAPEQLAMRPTYASDIYAVGVTALYLLTAKSPKDFDTNAATGELEWESAVNISEVLCRVLRKTMELSLRNRYKSAIEVLKDVELEPYAANLSLGLATVQPNLTTPTEQQQPHVKASTAKQAEEIRAFNERRRQKTRNSVPETGRLGTRGSMSGDITTAQNSQMIRSLKLPSKIDAEVILEFYAKGWRDFAQQNLNNLILRHANLAGSNFHQSQLIKINLYGSDLSNSDLGSANLSKSILKNTRLINSYLSYCNLEEADLRGADLTGANLNHANLKRANLCGANLSNAFIKDDQLALAKTNWATVLPSGRRFFL